MDRRVLTAVLLLVIAVGGYAFRWELQSLAWYSKVVAYERVAPLTWPTRPFSAAEWARSPASLRHVYVRDLMARLRGLSRAEASQLIGEQLKGDSWSWKLHELEPGGVSYALIVELKDDRVHRAEIRSAWFCP